ncbi:glycosyltransferase [uncultured Dokdonia sp.]|uniref:glycosyltransferase family 2 protein n=1 Tax=uncultured Dokdonia sp. TaxID=575653 RepID=UPI00262B5720|nr:glycosyltransferase [uncultured Dokdonia sp.]
MIVLIILYGIMISYVLLIGALSYGVKRVPYFTSQTQIPTQGFSVIIPFRNEEANLPQLLESLAALTYPESLYEVLLINDASEDNSVACIESFIESHQLTNITITDNIRVSDSPKKDAIQTAIEIATHSWIVTTDADCIVPTLWLSTLNTFIQENNSKLVAGPVSLPPKTVSFLNAFEQMDTLSLAGATIGGFGIGRPFLCNGAHLAYEKAAFLTLGGFQGNNHIASGDDHFMLEKFTTVYPKQVHYLKSKQAIITTTFQEDWASYIAQRTRWAAKSTGYTKAFTKGVGLLILMSNLTFVVGVVFAFAKADKEAFPFYILLFIKIVADSFLLYPSAQFFKKLKLFFWYPLCALWYPFISSYIALVSLKGGFTWKGRYFKR